MTQPKYPPGVYRDHGRGQFKAKLYDNSKYIYLGSFGSAEEASIAYKKEKELRKPIKPAKSKPTKPTKELKGTPFYGL